MFKEGGGREIVTEEDGRGYNEAKEESMHGRGVKRRIKFPRVETY